MSSAKDKAKEQFKSVTGATESVALECLKKHNYNLQRALNYYYSTSSITKPSTTSPAKGDKAKIEKIFNKYAGSGEDKDSMFEEKREEFFKELKIETDSLESLAMAWKLQAANPAEFSRHEFIKGWSEMGIDTTAGIKTKITETVASFKDRATFKEFYRWLFNFAKDGDVKTIEVDTALQLWSVVLKDQWTLCDKWLKFIQKEGEKAKKKEGGLKAVSRDIWDQILEFSKDIKADFSNLEDDGAWPGVVDEFVEWVNESQGKGKKKEKPKVDDD